MSKNVNTQQNDLAAETTNKIEKFFETNKKKVVAVLVLLAAAAVAIFFWANSNAKDEAAAKEAIYPAQAAISGQNPNYELALEDLLDVIEQYGSTTVGNIANHYAGVCYLNIGDLDNAEKYLQAYKPVEGSIYAEIIKAQNIGLQGDIAVERGEYEKAADLFKQAVEVSDNELTAPYYLFKQALALNATGDVEGAKVCYQTIVEKYPTAAEKEEADDQLF